MRKRKMTRSRTKNRKRSQNKNQNKKTRRQKKMVNENRTRKKRNRKTSRIQPKTRMTIPTNQMKTMKKKRMKAGAGWGTVCANGICHHVYKCEKNLQVSCVGLSSSESWSLYVLPRISEICFQNRLPTEVRTMDFVSLLPFEVTVKILSNLTDRDLCHLECLSRAWNRVASSTSVWMQQVGSTNNIGADQLATSDLSQQQVRDWKRLYIELSRSVNWVRNLAELNSEKNRIPLIKEALAASSTDHKEQGIENTLDKEETFWSSTGSSTEDANEWLLYKLVQPICVVTSVSINIYKALYQAG